MESATAPPVIVRFLRLFALRYTPVYAVGLAALLATNYINVLIPQYIQKAIDGLDQNAPYADVEGAAYALGGLAAVVVITRTLSRILFFNPGRTIEFRLKNEYFYHVMRLPLATFQKWSAGELISRGSNDITYVRTVIGFATLQILNLSMALTLALYQMVLLDMTLTLYCALPLAVGVVLLRKGIRSLLNQFREGQKQLSTLSTSILNAYSGAPIIQSLQAENVFENEFRGHNEAYVDTQKAMSRISAFALPLVQVAGSSCLAILLYFGGIRAQEGEMTVGEIAAYASYLGIVVAGLTSSGWMINALQRGLASLDRVYEVLDLPQDLPHRDVAHERTKAKGSPLPVRASNLQFTYPGNPENGFQLKGVDFTLKAGETLGLFGPTGSGKSTLLSLIAGLYPLKKGTVFLGDEDLTDIPDHLLRESVAFVPQNAYLFSRTVAENVGFSDRRNAIQPDRIQKGLTLACLEDDMGNLSDGLDTLVGERGVTLSGGQRQRIALARAFYGDFDLLLLDDVLSAVDHNTERALVENIRERTSEFTTIVASHRISAFRYADRILVLQDGEVTHQGTHEELVKRDGPYREAWEMEESGEERHED